MKNVNSLCCKPKKDNKKENFFCDLLSEYSSTTTIHGIPYFTDNTRSWIERLWWVIGFIFSATVCSYLISKTWIKWKENPVIVSFAQEHTPIWEIPFPAVTVCPLNKINQQDYNYTAFYHILILDIFPENLKEKDIDNWEQFVKKGDKIFWKISILCNLDYNYIYRHVVHDNFSDESLVKTIRYLAPKMNVTLKDVVWQNEKYSNMSSKNFLFYEQITSEGLCFTFNALGHDDMYTDEMKQDELFITHNKKSTGWTIEEGYKDNNNYAKSYPERTSQAGLMFGLSADFLIEPYERDGYCGDSVAGFKVLLHNPAEIPRLREQYFLAPAKQQVTVAVTPKVIRTSSNLRNIPPHSRNCYFASEKNLRFFKIYTQFNCKTECEANITKQYCGCLPFYLPRDVNTKVCGFGKRKCLNDVKNQVFKYESMLKNDDREITEDEKNELEIFQKCDCLPSCDSIDYEVELSQAEYLYEISKDSGNEESNSTMKEMEITPMNIFFKESQFLALDRNELYGQTDFIANIGGLLGLFLGFSFLSFLEIAYFLTLRMWCKFYNQRQIKKKYVSSKIPEAWVDKNQTF